MKYQSRLLGLNIGLVGKVSTLAVSALIFLFLSMKAAVVGYYVGSKSGHYGLLSPSESTMLRIENAVLKDDTDPPTRSWVPGY